MRYTIFFLISLFAFPLFADVPVVDANSNNTMTQAGTGLVVVGSPNPVAAQISHTSAQIEQLQQTIRDLRELIQAQGEELARLKRRQQAVSNTVVNTNMSPITTPVVATSDQKDQQAYQAAYGLIQNKQYSDAMPAMQDYLKRYPKGQYAANATYWLAQLSMLSGENEQARNYYLIVAKQYSTSNKAPDAMLQVGLLAYADTNYQEAEEWWEKVIKKYPKTSAALAAQTRLQALKQSGQ